MDIRCPKCGEPWELDCLHDEVERRRPDLSYARRGYPGYASAEDYATGYPRALRDVREDFYRRGCVAIGGDPCEATDRGRTAAAVYDLLGDDLDGAAAMLEDAEALGL